jgi:hypothetical protein
LIPFALSAGCAFVLMTSGCASLSATVPTFEPLHHPHPPVAVNKPVAFVRTGATPAMVEADTLACHEVAHHMVMGPAPVVLEPAHTQQQQIQDTLHRCMEKRGYAVTPLRLALAGKAPAPDVAPAASAEEEAPASEPEPVAAAVPEAAEVGTGGDGGGDGGGDEGGDDDE